MKSHRIEVFKQISSPSNILVEAATFFQLEAEVLLLQDLGSALLPELA